MRTFISIVSVAAVVCNIFFVWPQAVKILRSKSIEGVSPGTWTISTVLFSVWASYALHIKYWSLFAANASCWVAAALLMVVGTRSGWDRRWYLMAGVGVSGAVLFGFWGPSVLGVVMTVAGIALRVPQLLLLLRGHSSAGVSSATWLLGAATSGCWLLVSLQRHATMVVVANSTALTMTLLLLLTLFAVRVRESRVRRGL
jgi:uncharacterized protein with PQ loop repeat